MFGGLLDGFCVRTSMWGNGVEDFGKKAMTKWIDLKKLTFWGNGDGELVFNGDRVSIWEDEKVLEMDGGDGYTLWMELMPLNFTFKND